MLSGYRLSWTSFSILYDLWVSGPLETRELAKLTAVSKATVSNITNTLERKEFCSRERDTEDKRISYVSITENGRKVMEELYPKFHQGEAEIVRSLDPEEQKQMSALLRRVIRDNQF
ncbi:DNA-binding transcriptional regulator, MarR family [Alkalicoccus daliensis]|uniref:DNA-binding transcriptional regulator, MarR family n=1 Tax=Alkalicoccus daliensis TaxID=745820 RepID=A0A1H0F1Q9_9BACI|nr:DNA-binding transcriptional regulator, MarR family [Alkalicoccus daliensis]